MDGRGNKRVSRAEVSAESVSIGQSFRSMGGLSLDSAVACGIDRMMKLRCAQVLDRDQETRGYGPVRNTQPGAGPK